jgi:hypothetical protein
VKPDKLAQLRKLVRKPKTGLIWYLRVGRCLLRLSHDEKYHSKWVLDAAEELGSSRTTFRRAMQLAETYPGNKFKAVTDLPFAVVKALLPIKDVAMRKQLQRSAKKHKWSVQEVHAEIERLYGRGKPRGGRKRKPGDEYVDLRKLAKTTQHWRRFVDEVWPGARLRKLKRGGEKLARLTNDAKDAMQALIEALESRPVPE